jgi:hypothetical protein
MELVSTISRRLIAPSREAHLCHRSPHNRRIIKSSYLQCNDKHINTLMPVRRNIPVLDPSVFVKDKEYTIFLVVVSGLKIFPFLLGRTERIEVPLVT